MSEVSCTGQTLVLHVSVDTDDDVESIRQRILNALMMSARTVRIHIGNHARYTGSDSDEHWEKLLKEDPESQGAAG